MVGDWSLVKFDESFNELGFSPRGTVDGSEERASALTFFSATDRVAVAVEVEALVIFGTGCFVLEVVLIQAFKWRSVSVCLEDVFRHLMCGCLVRCALKSQVHARGIHIFCGSVEEKDWLIWVANSLAEAVCSVAVAGEAVVRMGGDGIGELFLVHGPLSTVHENSACVFILVDLERDVSTDLAMGRGVLVSVDFAGDLQVSGFLSGSNDFSVDNFFGGVNTLCDHEVMRD